MNGQTLNQQDHETVHFPSLEDQFSPFQPQQIDLLSFGKVNLLPNVEEKPDINEQLLKLTVENQMKTEALEKASKMIQLLEEERSYLLQEIDFLNQQISLKIKKIEELESNGKSSRENSEGNTNKIENVSGSKLLFSFAQLRPPNTPSTQAKTFQMSSLRIKPAVCISQELPAWQQGRSVLGELKETVSGEYNESEMLKDIEDVMASQQMQSQLLKWSLEERLDQIQDLIQSDQGQSFADASLKSSSTETERSFNFGSSRQIIAQYEQLLFNYQSYSAYLKAYLCEAINQISRLKDNITISNDIISKIPFLSSQIQQMKAEKMKLAAQNRDLHCIVSGLIHNVKILQRKQQR